MHKFSIITAAILSTLATGCEPTTVDEELALLQEQIDDLSYSRGPLFAARIWNDPNGVDGDSLYAKHSTSGLELERTPNGHRAECIRVHMTEREVYQNNEDGPIGYISVQGWANNHDGHGGFFTRWEDGSTFVVCNQISWSNYGSAYQDTWDIQVIVFE